MLWAFVFAAGAAIGQGCDWAPLRTGVSPAASACAVLTNGGVVYGGRFSLVGLSEVDFVARWDGVARQRLRRGLDAGSCRALALL